MTTRSSTQVGLVGGAGFLLLLPKIISSGAQYVTLHSKSGWRKSNTCRFDSEKWFGSIQLYRLQWLVKVSAALCTYKKECTKYDLTAAQCFWLAHHNDWSRWFVINSPPPICCPSLSFIGGVAKEYITKLGLEKYFRRVTYWAQLEML
jgi:hypothetical protein